MEFSTTTVADLAALETPALAAGVFKDGQLCPTAQKLDALTQGRLQAIVQSEFEGAPGTQLVVHAPAGLAAQRVVLLGLGKREALTARAIARAHETLGAWCVQARITSVVSTLCSLECPDATPADLARAAARILQMATYRYEATFSEARPANRLDQLVVHVEPSRETSVQSGLKQGAAIGAGANLARLLGDLPPNLCTPAYLGRTARELARQFPTLKADVLDRKKIEALRMGSFLSVARGSVEPPAFIILRHTPAEGAPASSQAPIVLVGKGVTFDSGGISLKPGQAMDEMKFDMCGAASVLGTLRAVAELDLPREVIGLIPACENLPSGSANKPGDIVTSLSGQTIEILNTDAEGRLILCDALTYAERFKPAAVIDIATLTGACVIALGHVNSGLFTEDDALADALLQAGRQALDPAWRMPLESGYQDQLKSNFADMANIGGRPAGAVTAACFLSRFTRSYPWAHLDIAGTAWHEGKKKGATGRPVSLLTHYLLAQCEA